MVFPSEHIRSDVRVDHHREFWPHNMTKMRDKELGVLWTSCVEKTEDSDSEEKSVQITYNHIVPLINRYARKIAKIKKSKIIIF